MNINDNIYYWAHMLDESTATKDVDIDEEESITNNEIYLDNMSKSFGDKAWFLKYIPKGIDTLVDFGGGTGDFAKFCQKKMPGLKCAVIDNNASFSDKAKENGFITASDLQQLRDSKTVDFNKSVLNMSSVIHEIYSYADPFYDDVGVFWTDVKKCGFKAISIRDMSFDEQSMRNAPIDAIVWVYQNVLKSDTIFYKNIPFKDITDSFEEVWGNICDVSSKKVNFKQLIHFLIKYRYQENWSREVEENYLPVSKQKLANILTSMGYKFIHKESSKLEFYGKCWKKDFKLSIPDNDGYRQQFLSWLLTLDTHIKWFLVKADSDYEKTLDENKATYLQKYKDEDDVKSVVEMFWAIRSRLKAPENDIDWWIKKPFNDLKRFVQTYTPQNKKERRDINCKQKAQDDGAKLLGTKDGYEIWYVPTYDAMVTLGRFYKGRSAKWCVASDDPEFWFDNHDEDEFVVLVRQTPKHDEFDKIAIQMEHRGRYYNEDDIVPWDLENNDWTFTNDDLIHDAWLLFIDNGEQREQYQDIDNIDEY